MKKLFAVAIVAVLGVCFFGHSADAVSAPAPAVKAVAAPGPKPVPQPEQVLGGYCCDANGVRRCVINPSPVNTGCYCYGQGNGWVCL
jgi:hypothetical protein